MFQKEIYSARRNRLKEKMGAGKLLFLGNEESPMNYTDNTYHFRQDSSFLYFFGIDQPHLAAVIDVDNDETIIFGDELTMDHIVWMGEQPSIQALAAQVGVEKVQPYHSLEGYLQKNKTGIQYLPPYRHLNIINLHHWLDIPLKAIQERASEQLTKAVIDLRLVKGAEELAEMEKAVNISRDMHTAAIQQAKAGMLESEVTGKVHGIAVGSGGNLAYPIIMTINGQILHNHYHGNVMQTGQLLLGDFGAETPMHYAGDITRTSPVAPTFTTQQKEIYNLVLKAEEDSIAAMKPGVLYRDIHLSAAKIMASGLKELGIMKGNIDDAVAQGAHALFFPHGLGHAIGLDVHDMEDLREDWVGYSDAVKRSSQFGLRSLRFGKELEEGYVMTVEPGLYFIPQLIDKWQASKQFTEFINYDALKAYRNFGGIRIEDNIVVTATGQRILGQRIPKTVEEVEELKSVK